MYKFIYDKTEKVLKIYHEPTNKFFKTLDLSMNNKVALINYDEKTFLLNGITNNKELSNCVVYELIEDTIQTVTNKIIDNLFVGYIVKDPDSYYSRGTNIKFIEKNTITNCYKSNNELYFLVRTNSSNSKLKKYDLIKQKLTDEQWDFVFKNSIDFYYSIEEKIFFLFNNSYYQQTLMISITNNNECKYYKKDFENANDYLRSKNNIIDMLNEVKTTSSLELWFKKQKLIKKLK